MKKQFIPTLCIVCFTAFGVNVWGQDAPLYDGGLSEISSAAAHPDDIYWEEDPAHPSDIIGAALAAAEANNKSGRDALVAILIAYELTLRWCHAAKPGVDRRRPVLQEFAQFVRRAPV